MIRLKDQKILDRERKADLFGLRIEKTCLRGFANNKGADQPVHPSSLISAFDIHLLGSFISRLAMSEIFNFLASL